MTKPDKEPDRCALNNVHYRYWILDLQVYFRHAPARLRVDAIVFALAHDYAAVCLLSRSCSLKALLKLGVGLGWL